MFCPVCLSFSQQVEAVAQVSGTQFCAAHSVEALLADQRRPGSTASGVPHFTPPRPPVPTPPDPTTP